MSEFKFIDLFAGLGGFHVALEQLGGKGVFAAEIQPHLRTVYANNFGLTPAGDIREIVPADVPDHDILCAGFPCQSFSKAGDQLGFKCSRQGMLFFDVVTILKEKRPKYFILENVPNLLKHDGGTTYLRIKKELRELDYDVAEAKLSPHHFGIPQIRERVYIVGQQNSLSDFKWPERESQSASIAQVLEDFPPDAKPLSQKTLDCLSVWSRFLELCPKEVELPSAFPIWSMEFGATYPFEDSTPFAERERLGDRALDDYMGTHGRALAGLPPDEQWGALPSHARTAQAEFPKWKKDFIRANRKFYADNRHWIDPWLPLVKPFISSHQKFEWNAKGGERNLWKYVIQFRASGVRVKRPTTSPSLVAMTDTQVPIIAWQKRYMTPRECAKLQSLGHLKYLPEPQGKAFAALGNAVNAKVVEKVARALLRHDALPATEPSPSKRKRHPILETA
jgi:DNA (cytosine-5)-methyltransferase 1